MAKANSNDDGSVSMTFEIPGDVYYFLKKIAEKDRRSMKQEVFFLIEQSAKNMGIELNYDNINVQKHFIETEAIRAAEEDIPYFPDNKKQAV